MSEYKNIPAELDFYQLALDNALDNSVIQTHLDDVGYVADRLKAGRAKLLAVQDLYHGQRGEYGQRRDATDGKSTAVDAANQAYLPQLKLARIVIKNPGDRGLLKLDGDRKEKWSDWRDQVESFYTNILKRPDLQTRLLDVNLTVAKLTAAHNLVEAAFAARDTQSTEYAEAQNATEARDAALDDLRDWMSDYLAAARVALEDQPQLLEALGILVRSNGASHASPTPSVPDLPNPNS